jgi:hypothetical protein
MRRQSILFSMSSPTASSINAPISHLLTGSIYHPMSSSFAFSQVPRESAKCSQSVIFAASSPSKRSNSQIGSDRILSSVIFERSRLLVNSDEIHFSSAFDKSLALSISHFTSGSSMHWNSNPLSQSMAPIDSLHWLMSNSIASNALVHSGVLKQSWTYCESVVLLRDSRELDRSQGFLESQLFTCSHQFGELTGVPISYPYYVSSGSLASNRGESKLFHRSFGFSRSDLQPSVDSNSAALSEAQSTIITFSGFMS